jgi:Rrf2 family nitric oxide-sensitive transcriptional repressor
MRLTSYSNFSLRTLMVAAMRAPKLSTVQQVADAFGISRAHLVKCVHQLGQWGYLENLRGNHGGFRLARPATEITIGEIVRRTEEGFDLVECFAPETASCPLVGRCRLSAALEKARDVFLEELDAVTIADVTTNGGEVLSILDLDGGAMASECEALRAAAAASDAAGRLA